MDEFGDRSWSVAPLTPPTKDRQGRWNYSEGLTTIQCLDFLLNLPQHNTKAFAYSFNYDLTKILQDMPEEALYKLFRPELRQRRGKDAVKGPHPVRWKGYRLNLQGTKFTVAKGSRHRVVWDVWKFFQSKFTSALKDWKIGDAEMLDRMIHMKDKRADFDKESPEAVKAYCLEECRYMAELARKLYDAHVAAGLKLQSFYGAGSTSSAMLHTMGIKKKIKEPPEVMLHAIASAFFGGRFENSVIGEVPGPIYNWDISSAYPYQLCFLPCLLHGKWTHTTNRKDIEGSTAALIRYSLSPLNTVDRRSNPRITTPGSSRRATGSPQTLDTRAWQSKLTASWGPFPYRSKTGAISFPVESGGGWIWKEEFIVGERIFPNVEFHEARVYHSTCDCKPFDKIPGYYLERLRIGKEGPGIVLKLGMNGGYGKLAQSVGNGIFNCWSWAGMITSNVRAQLLELLELHKDPANLLMFATDGVQTRELIVPPKPKNTDTDSLEFKKPLGGWELKTIPQGVFYGRPGIYFPLNPTVEEIKEIRGRGIGKATVLENHKKIVASWNRFGMHRTVDIDNVSRFCGAKSSISRTAKGDDWIYKRADGSQKLSKEEIAAGKQNVRYGQWVTRAVKMSFNPLPKRECVNPDGMTLKVRAFSDGSMSIPYVKAMRSIEAKELEKYAQELHEQPEVDYSDYEIVTDEPGAAPGDG